MRLWQRILSNPLAMASAARRSAAHGYCVGLITPASLAGEAAYNYAPYAVPSVARGNRSFLQVILLRKPWRYF
jgi:hypothetical protein